MRKALVVGGAGFIGSHLCGALLAEGAKVICVDQSYISSIPELDTPWANSRFFTHPSFIISPKSDSSLFEFNRDDSVTVSPLIMRKETKEALEENLLMFYTGITHDANAILAEQRKNISQEDKTQNLIELCSLASRPFDTYLPR